MGTCPHCRTSSRVDPDAFTFERILVAKPLGTFSISGQTLKMPVVELIQITCRCGTRLTGYLDGDDIAVEKVELPGDRDEAADDERGRRDHACDST